MNNRVKRPIHHGLLEAVDLAPQPFSSNARRAIILNSESFAALTTSCDNPGAANEVLSRAFVKKRRRRVKTNRKAESRRSCSAEVLG